MSQGIEISEALHVSKNTEVHEIEQCLSVCTG